MSIITALKLYSYNYIKCNKYHAFHCFFLIHSVVLNYHKVILSLNNITGI